MTHHQVNALLSLDQISKRYSSHTALNKVSLSVNQGEVVLLVGANGAGKSTLLKILSGLTRADRGTISYGAETSQAFRSKIGYLGHEPLLYPTLTVLENISLFAKLYRAKTEPAALLEEFKLNHLAARELRRLSKGELFRVGLCRTFLNTPKLFLLDEPTASLDELGTESLMQKVSRSCANGAAAIIASHDLRRLLQYATRLIVMKKGEIVRDSGAESFHSAVAIQWYVEAQH